ncbi:MAG TPA: hypothetical protein V6D23_00155, partial [Candidatus Obscuribacterales bacterium]
DFHTAFGYLNDAGRIARNNHLIAAFQQAIGQALEKKYHQQLEQTDFSQEFGLDIDLLYEATERKIHAIVREQLESPPPKLCCTYSDDFGQLKQQNREYSQAYWEIRRSLRKLEKELDTQALAHMLLPYESYLARIKEIVQISERFCALYAALQLGIRQLTHWSSQVRELQASAEAGQLESRLEQFLDQEDRHRQELLDLKLRGFLMQELDQAFALYKDQLETFIETIDENTDETGSRLRQTFLAQSKREPIRKTKRF